MMELSIAELGSVLGGQLRFGSPPPRDGHLAIVGRVVTDSRQVAPGDVFWALRGSKQHGADFADDAMQRGALGVVLSDRRVEPWAGAFVLEVADSKLGLWQLADWNRRRFGGLVVAVSGGVGQASCREMIDAVLQTQGAGVARPCLGNAEVDVPLSILELAPQIDYGVLELASEATGGLDALARLSAPQIGVATRIASSQQVSYSDFATTASATSELLAALGIDGQAVLCGDDALLRRLASTCRSQILWYGRSGDCDVTASEVRCGGGRLNFRVERQAFSVPVWGRHHLDAALAAISVGLIYGCSLSESADALGQFQRAAACCEVTRAHGAIVIKDAYGARAQSTHAVLQLLYEYPTSGQRIALVSDLEAPGPLAPRLHFEVGRQIVTTAGADRLLACGKYASQVAAGAMDAGMARHRVEELVNPAACAQSLRRLLSPGDALLLSGAGANELQRVIESLTSSAAQAA